MRLRTFAISNDSYAKEHRLMHLARNPDMPKPVDMSKKQEEGPKVPYIPLKGENPQKFAEFLNNAPQYLQSVKTSEFWRDQIKNMEQWLYSTNAGGKDRAGQNEHVRQRNIWLKQQGAPYTISQQLDANDPQDRDIIKINFPENREPQQLMALKQRRAQLKREISAVNIQLFQSENMKRRGGPPEYYGRKMKENNALLKKLQDELATVEQAILTPMKTPPTSPVIAGTLPNAPRFGSQMAPENRFDLDAALQRIQPPEAAQKIKQLPQELQGPVLKTYESLPAGSQQMLVGLLNGFTALAPNVQQNVWALIAGGNNAIQASPEAQQFMLSLTPEQRQLFDRIAGESIAMQQQGEVLNEATLQRIRTLISKHNSAKTDNDRMLAEGTMRMLGVDVDATNYDPNNVRMLPQDGMRVFALFVGLLQVITALAGKSGIGDKEGNVIRKTKEAAKAKNDTEMTPEERTKKKKELKENIGKSIETEKTLQKNYDKMKDDMDTDPDPTDHKEKEESLVKLKEELEALVKARKELEKKLAKMNDVEKSKATPKKEEKKETLTPEPDTELNPLPADKKEDE